MPSQNGNGGRRGIACTPPPSQPAQTSVVLPAPTHRTLALWRGRSKLAQTDNRQRWHESLKSWSLSCVKDAQRTAYTIRDSLIQPLPPIGRSPR